MVFDVMQGRLGMHQDKDESHESLRAGIPVVSFSFGDTAEFLYGPSRDEGSAQVMTRTAQASAMQSTVLTTTACCL